MGVSLGVDLGDLEACFGGFSPTAMRDATQSVERAREAEVRLKQRQAAQEQAALVERARASEPREHEDAAGARWRYVVLDGTQVRIERCLKAPAQLEAPSQLEGMPVVALADDACAYLDGVEGINVPDSVLSIGFSAFRGCRDLRSIRFPARLARFDSYWLQGAQGLERMRLPGQLEKVPPAVFDLPGLRHLEIGAGTAGVMPGAFAKSALESIGVVGDGALLWSDGRALYAADRSVLLALAVPGEAYEVAEGCRAIAKKGLSGFGALRSVQLPASMEVIGDFAYAQTGIEGFAAPPALRAIGERAFFGCSSLRTAQLNEGLASIGDNAFSATAIERLRIPASVEELGSSLADRTSLTYAGPGATFSIDGGSPHLRLDGSGGLYRVSAEGLELVRMMDPAAEEYVVDPACTAIGEGAFFRHSSLQKVVLPEGLRSIGPRAFRECGGLFEATLPSTLEELGDEAFLGTNLRSMRVPAGLRRIGAMALVTEGAHRGTKEPSLADVAVDAGNERFRMEAGLLIERLDAGYERVVLCTGSVPDVTVPIGVKAIAPYAFSGVRTLRTLGLSDRITMVESRGLAFDSLVERIRLSFEEPIEGHSAIELEFPRTTRAAQQMMLAFSVPSFVDAGEILAHYDNAILNASGFDAETEQGLDPYEQVTRIIARLRDPLLMTPANRSLADKVMRSHLKSFVMALARHDDKEGLASLMDAGYLDAGNIADAIGYVAPMQDASVTNFLLEAQRRRFGQGAVDFDRDFEL